MTQIVDEIKKRLMQTGLDENEAEILLFQFLYQHAFEFVELVYIYQNDLERYKRIVGKKSLIV